MIAKSKWMRRKTVKIRLSVGKLEDIHVYLHYETFEQAKQKWIERLEAAEYGQSLYYYGAKDGCTERNVVHSIV